MANLNEKRTFFHLSAIDENLYAVGGRNAAGELATVEKYYAKENQVFVKSLVLIVIFKVAIRVQNARAPLWPCGHGL